MKELYMSTEDCEKYPFASLLCKCGNILSIDLMNLKILSKQIVECSACKTQYLARDMGGR